MDQVEDEEEDDEEDEDKEGGDHLVSERHICSTIKVFSQLRRRD